jgi:hypothetical protein
MFLMISIFPNNINRFGSLCLFKLGLVLLYVLPVNMAPFPPPPTPVSKGNNFFRSFNRLPNFSFHFLLLSPSFPIKTQNYVVSLPFT